MTTAFAPSPELEAAEAVSGRAGIRNAGGLFSPYYLFDLMHRLHRDELDVEAREQLRRELRPAFRAADRTLQEGASVDELWDGWLTWLFELLGFELRAPDPTLHQHGTARLGWLRPDGLACDELGSPLAYVRVAPYGRDLDDAVPLRENPDRERVSPVRVLEVLLDAQDRVDWGLATNGRELRLLRRGGQVSGQALIADIPALLDADRQEEWTALAACFRAASFAVGKDGRSFLQTVLEDSERHSGKIAADLREAIVEAIEALVQAVIDQPANHHLWGGGPPVNGDARRLFEEALLYLYRLLFVAYAEARELLPVSAPAYRDAYSFEALRDLADRPLPRGAESGGFFIASLRALWQMCRNGYPSLGQEAPFRITAFGGLLFDPSRTEWLDGAHISDRAMREVVRRLSVERAKRGAKSAPRRFSYADLGVDQLGSIYEGLLAYEPEITERPRVEARLVDQKTGRLRGDVLLVDQERLRTSRRLQQVSEVVYPAGRFLLRAAGSRRKATGSYYTPEVVAEAFVERLCHPLTEPVVERCAERDAHDRPKGSPEEILDLAICDPAMGSGAFLIQVVRQLADAYGRARIAAGLDDDGRISAEERAEAKRLVATHCVYGVDLNPLAVDLARVSIWLETLAAGEPLSFLDDRLRCGDALVGSTIGLPEGEMPDRIAKDAFAATWAGKSAASDEAKAAGRAAAKRNNQALGRLAKGQLSLLVDADEVTEAITAFREAREDLAEGVHLDASLIPLERETERGRAYAEARQERRLVAVRRLADLWAASWFWPERDVPPPSTDDLLRLGDTWLTGRETPADLVAVERTAGEVAAERRFLHWGLEYPEVFTRRRPGFDLVLGNPPWEKIGSKAQELLAPLDPELLALSGPAMAQRVRRLRQEEALADRWWRDDERFQRQMSHFIKKAGRYRWVTTGQHNTARLFVEQGFRMAREVGWLGQILPSRFYRLEASAAAKAALMAEARWEMLLACENERKIFPIRNYDVFALCQVRRGEPGSALPALFLIGKDDFGEWRCPDAPGLASALRHFDDLATRLDLVTIRALAPKTLSPPEFRDPRDAELFRRIVELPPLGDPASGWTPEFGREIDSTGDSDLFRDESWLLERGATRADRNEWVLDGRRVVPVIGGRQIAQFQYGFTPIDRWCLLEEAEERIKPAEGSGLRSHDRIRVAFRDVAQTSDMRTMRAALIPAKHVARNKAPYVRAGTMPARSMALLAAVFNSFAFDYEKRTLGLGSSQFGPMRQLRIPRPAVVEEALPFALAATRPDWLRAAAATECGVEPADVEWPQARAEIDAIVAAAFGFSLPDLCFVLSRFPLLDTQLGRQLWMPLPGEDRSTITRDIALLAYAQRLGDRDVDVGDLAVDAGVKLPQLAERSLRTRVEQALALEAVPYAERPKAASYHEWSAGEDDEEEEVVEAD